jgi:glycosyltransferase involved in cell wall biosynthesis
MMDNLVAKKVALVINTDGLEYDDRVRKEIVSVQKLFPNIKFKIFAMIGGKENNKESEGVTTYGTPYKTYYLKSRDKYKNGEKDAIKLLEFTFKVLPDIREYEAVWFAEITGALALMLSHNRYLLWDLHEIPARFFRNNVTKLALKYIFRKCNVVLHANPARINYMKELGLISTPSKHHAIRNYPNFEDIDSEYDQKYYDCKNWIGEKKCVYLQGLFADRRAPFETISAVMDTPNLIAIVVGAFDTAILYRLYKKYSEISIKERIRFVGKIQQLKIPQYLLLCSLSLVFYKNVSANNFYCEANRFYQSLVLGVPVVCGNNPSMKEIVEQYGVGISIDDDGSSVEKISKGITELVKNEDTIKTNIAKSKDNFFWNSQESIIVDAISKFIS